MIIIYHDALSLLHSGRITESAWEIIDHACMKNSVVHVGLSNIIAPFILCLVIGLVIEYIQPYKICHVT